MSKKSNPNFEMAIFPLQQSVLFPEAAVPLNIFEPRYVAMVNWALETDGLIALTSGVPQPLSLKVPWIVAAGVPQLLERRPDGTMLILLRGKERFSVQSIEKKEPYILVSALMSPRGVEGEVVDNPNYKWLCRLMEQWVCEQAEREADREKLRSQFWNPWALVDWYGTLILNDGLLKQALLEMNDIVPALEMAMRIFPATKVEADSQRSPRWDN
jgi:Lon protease-like protein